MIQTGIKLNALPRSYKQITAADLRRLAQIAAVDRQSFFERRPETGRLYRRRLFAVALCQGAAKHYVDGKNGIKDFDVWSFFRSNPEREFPPRRVGKADFGDPKFGKAPDHPDFLGRASTWLGTTKKWRTQTRSRQQVRPE